MEAIVVEEYSDCNKGWDVFCSFVSKFNNSLTLFSKTLKALEEEAARHKEEIIKSPKMSAWSKEYSYINNALDSILQCLQFSNTLYLK